MILKLMYLSRPSLAMISAWMVLATTVSAQLGVGDSSDDVEFALFEGGSLANGKLTAFTNQIVVLYYYTPW